MIHLSVLGNQSENIIIKKVLMKTSTKNTVIAGIFTAIGAFLGSSYSNYHLNTTNNNSNTNNNIINITEKGETSDEDIYKKYEEEIDKLESENEKLKEDNQKLLEQRQELINMSDLSPSLEETPNVISTESNKTIYLMEDCPPYDVPGINTYNDSNEFKVEGEKCNNGFSFGSPGPLEDYYVLFNLDQKYTSIEFDFGHVDGSSRHDCELVVYLDGNYYETYNKKADEIKSHEKIDTINAKQLKFAYCTGYAGAFGDYAIFNITASLNYTNAP